MRIAFYITTLLLLTFAGQAWATKIYKTVDENGNVVFTDVPPQGEKSKAEEVDVEPANGYAPTQGQTGENGRQLWIVDDPRAPEQTDPGEMPTTVSYRVLEITTPGADEAVRSNNGNLTVSGRIDPQLAPGHQLQLTLDGQIQGQHAGTSFALQNLNRGTHTATLRVVDDANNVLFTSSSRTFHILRAHR